MMEFFKLHYENRQITMLKINLFIIPFLITQILSFSLSAEENNETKKIGFIGSLSGIAGAYGNEVLNGIRLAIEENSENTQIKLIVEDDASQMKNGLSSFNKLVSVDGVQSIIAGSWWANVIVKPAESKNIPLISVETSYNKDTIIGNSYFIMQGDLHDWINVYEPLIKAKKWKKAAIIHFSSGFGLTLAEAMKDVFSREDRKLVADLEYSDIDANEARLLVLKLKTANPDVLYFDGQPGSLAITLKRLHELGMSNLPVLTNSIAEDMCKNTLFECKKIKELYFNKRKILNSDFIEKYKSKYGKMPYLNSDLAYYSTKVLINALSQKNPIQFIKSSNSTIDGVNFTFDDKNILQNLKQEIWQIHDGEMMELHNKSILRSSE